LGSRKGIRPVKKTQWLGAGMVICLEQGADLHMTQLMPLPLTVSCFSNIQIGFTFPVPAHPGSSGKRAVKLVYVCISAEAVHTPLTSVSGFLAMSTGLSVSNRGAVVRQLVGRPAGRKPAHTSPGMYTDNICTNSRQQMIPRDDQNSIHYKNTTISAGMTCHLINKTSHGAELH